MKTFNIRHSTWYGFNGEVTLEPHRLRLRPREDHDLRIASSRLDISPQPQDVRWYRDVENNSVAILTFDKPCTELEILSEVQIQQYDQAPLDFLVEAYAVHYPFRYTDDDYEVLRPFVERGEVSDALRSWVGQLWRQGETIQSYTLLKRICSAIKERFAYQVREEPGVQSPEQTLSLGSGSCRDFANLFMAAARHLGFAARFVSGYMFVPPGPELFGTTHAWAEVYIPGAGWKGFDPTGGELVGADHIPVAVARSAESVPPVEGAFTGPEGAQLKVGVWVRLLD
ncbi:Large protein containing transglutaminase-like domain [Marinobacterium lacunae]|uniref:Large protein containing transglutaminase-like domain n=1 Tax=Marinobacterium lacunae TaxID=1232683 RepID=A0A081FZE3_9GAMM|nr:transglutaminase family protein [Marinobacterium lacunae]KEA63898.1 Large protein containing transglutaminase-like domain [Marinobacterium lacunae]MBR9883399.1 transglutaminase family protein [Oceanospirillales bacterium]